ncbi:Uncharacterised protein [Mycobacteroides abscessus subsp. massiliense]|nr:Uncharacterised protein [Mycobacteroides abscessus subsp. massiliense]
MFDDGCQRRGRLGAVTAAYRLGQFPERVRPDGFAGQMRYQQHLHVPDRLPHLVENGGLIRDALHVPVEGGMFRKIVILVRIILNENLVDDHLIDPHSHQRQRSHGADGLCHHHPFGV